MQRIKKRIRLVLACGLILAVMTICTGCKKQEEQEETGIMELEPEEIEETGQEDRETAPAPAGEETGEDTGEDTSDIFVHVCGQVMDPGVYELEAGSRVFEALEAAGGLTPEAAGEYLNQARILEDGQQVYVPSLEEAREGSQLWQASAANPDAENSGAISGGASEGKVNVNQATREELMTLTGIGEVKAEAIIKYREEHGSFGSIEELKEVDGIKDGTFQKIRDDITV